MSSRVSVFHGNLLGNLGQARGGAKREKTPEVDAELLADTLQKVIQTEGVQGAFNFGCYHGAEKSMTIQGPVLSTHKNFLGSLARVEPTLTFKYSMLKSILNGLLKKFPDVRSRWPIHLHEHVGGDLAVSIMTLCTHARRLKNEEKFRQACSKCTEIQIQDLIAIRSFANDDPEDEEQHPQIPLPLDYRRFGRSTSCDPKSSQSNADDLPNTQEILDEQVPETPTDPCTPLKGPCSPKPCGTPDLLKDAQAVSPIPSRKQEIRNVINLMKKPAAAKDNCKKKPSTSRSSPSTSSMSRSRSTGSKSFNPATDELHLMTYPTGAVAIRVKNGMQLIQFKIPGYDWKQNKKVAEVYMKKLMDGIPLQEVMIQKDNLVKGMTIRS